MDFNDFAVLADDSWSLPQVNETRFYYLHDALGSVIGIVGGKFQRESDREFYLYDVYGATQEQSACKNPYLFTGRRLDILGNRSLKIYHNRARAYDPATGRFLQPDPIGYADSMNLYEYVTSNPINWVDPWGLSIENDLTPEQLKDLFMNPTGKDLEEVCDDQYLCFVADLLKFKEGRLMLLEYLTGGGVQGLESRAMGMTGVNAAQALHNAYLDDGHLMLDDPFITAGEIREPYKRRCYLNNCEERLKKLTRDAVIAAVSEAVTAGALKGGALLLKTLQHLRPAMGAVKPLTMLGKTGLGKASSCSDELAYAIANNLDDLLKDASGLGSSAVLKRPNIPFEWGWPEGGALGSTDALGNVTIRVNLTGDKLTKALRHESVHRFFSPTKPGPLQYFRANLGAKGYENSHLIRYFEEAAAHTYGTGSFKKGLGFPLMNPAYELSGKRVIGEGVGYLGIVGGGAYMGYKAGD